jgi:hypothetical protein
MIRSGLYQFFKIPLALAAICLSLFISCPQPESPALPSKAISAAIYPSDRVIFKEGYSLFTTTIFVQSSDIAIGSFSISVDFDTSLVQFESVEGVSAVVSPSLSTGRVTISGTNAAIGLGDGLDLATITWKAVATCITELSVSGSLTSIDGKGFRAEIDYNPTISVFEELGSFSLVGDDQDPDTDNAVKKGTPFIETLSFSTGGAIINEYDAYILFDPAKVDLDLSIGSNGLTIAPGIFCDSVSTGYGFVNLHGVSSSGFGPGNDIEMCTAHFNSIDSGIAAFSMYVNKVLTADNRYILPALSSSSMTISGSSNRPVVQVWLDPVSTIQSVGGYFTSRILVDSKGYKISAFGIDIKYDPLVLAPDTTAPHTNAVTEGADGFMPAVNLNNSGIIKTGGFQIEGKGPGSALELLIIYWKAVGTSASSDIKIYVKNLTDPNTYIIDRITAIGGTVTVQ